MIQLTKHHGLGNDFLVAVEPARPLTAADALAFCDRHTGIGADGLIQLVPAEGESATVDGRWVQTLWNADGSVAEISGNGIRCAGQALVNHLGASGSQRLLIDTAAGLRQLDVVETDRPGEHQIRVDMGSIHDGPPSSQRFAEFGVDVERQIGLDIGNPHLVALTDQAASVDLAVVGPGIEADYPDGLNVHFITVPDTATIDLRVWERGAGITEACGTGACVAAFAAHGWGLTDSLVTVNMPGGSVKVEVGESIYLTGPAVTIGAIALTAASSTGTGVLHG